MKSRFTSVGLKALATTSCVTMIMLGGTALTAQESIPDSKEKMEIAKDGTEPTAMHDPTETGHTWRDHVEEGDVRYTGNVMRVMGDKFVLRTPNDGAMTLGIPNDADYGGSVFSGNEVTVWTRDGMVVFFEGAESQGTVANDDRRMTTTADSNASMDGDNSEATTSTSTRRTATATTTAPTQSNRNSAAGDRDNDRWQGDKLPQTGSSLPATAGFGALLLLLGLALRKIA